LHQSLESKYSEYLGFTTAYNANKKKRSLTMTSTNAQPKPKRVKLRVMLLLSLLIGMTQLAGCSQPTGFCPAVVHPDDCARAYLKTLNPPQCFREYMANIGIQQHFIERECLPVVR
jgi:hypothetical protein